MYIINKAIFLKKLFLQLFFFFFKHSDDKGHGPSPRPKGLNVNDFFLLLGIFQSIPSELELIMRLQFLISRPFYNTILFLKEKYCSLDSLNLKTIYWEIIGEDNSVQHKYIKIFPPSNPDWETMHLILHVVTLATKTWIIQCKVVNHIKLLHTNNNIIIIILSIK